MRALLYGRANEPVNIRVCSTRSSVRSIVGAGNPDDDVIHETVKNDIVDTYAGFPGLYIWGWRDMSEAKKVFDWVEANFVDAFPGFRELMDMRMYIKRSISADAHIYINEERRVTHVFLPRPHMDRPARPSIAHPAVFALVFCRPPAHRSGGRACPLALQ